MSKKSQTTTQTSSFNDTAEDVLRKVTKSVWKKDGNTGELPAIPNSEFLSGLVLGSKT